MFLSFRIFDYRTNECLRPNPIAWEKPIDKDLRSLIVDTILSEGGDVATGYYSGNFRIYCNAILPLPLY